TVSIFDEIMLDAINANAVLEEVLAWKTSIISDETKGHLYVKISSNRPSY
ncbi:18943_t:CDS:1, partial [Racocetra persica]